MDAVALLHYFLKVQYANLISGLIAQSLPPRPEQPNYDVPKKLQSARAAMGEYNWNAYLEITEKFLDGIMTPERLQSETNKIFQVNDWSTAERIRSGVEDMVKQWRRQNSPEV